MDNAKRQAEGAVLKLKLAMGVHFSPDALTEEGEQAIRAHLEEVDRHCRMLDALVAEKEEGPRSVWICVRYNSGHQYNEGVYLTEEGARAWLDKQKTEWREDEWEFQEISDTEIRDAVGGGCWIEEQEVASV